MIKEGIQRNIVALNKQQKIFKAFFHAWKGIQHFFTHDRNGRIHLGAALASVFAGFSFKISAQTRTIVNLDKIAASYVTLGLSIGEYDPDFVDAYYGPDSLKPTSPKQDSFPKKFFLASIDSLISQLNDLDISEARRTKIQNR